jgi:hypothetical protein
MQAPGVFFRRGGGVGFCSRFWQDKLVRPPATAAKLQIKMPTLVTDRVFQNSSFYSASNEKASKSFTYDFFLNISLIQRKVLNLFVRQVTMPSM